MGEVGGGKSRIPSSAFRVQMAWGGAFRRPFAAGIWQSCLQLAEHDEGEHQMVAAMDGQRMDVPEQLCPWPLPLSGHGDQLTTNSVALVVSSRLDMRLSREASFRSCFRAR